MVQDRWAVEVVATREDLSAAAAVEEWEDRQVQDQTVIVYVLNAAPG
jgi:hypothetical protein